jgi:hypothetical protein
MVLPVEKITALSAMWKNRFCDGSRKPVEEHFPGRKNEFIYLL